MKEKFKVFNGDCVEIMDKLIEEGVKADAIITDPPYNISKQNNFHTMGRRGIDFGNWDKGFDLFSWIDKGFELLEKGGSMVIFNDWKNVGDIAKYSDSKGFEIKDMIRWKKTNPMPRNRDRRYITDFEVAVWLVKKGRGWTFNRLSDTYDCCEYIYPLTPKSEKVGHPTQKPVALMNEILKRHTNKGDIVLDPFMGSGTTGVACMNTGRKFIGIELDEEYFKIAENRIGFNQK